MGGRGRGQEREGGGEWPQSHEGDGGRGRKGDQKRGMSRESGGSHTASDAGTEEDEGDHAPLTALPWGTQ